MTHFTLTRSLRHVLASLWLLATPCIHAAPLLPPGYRPLPAGIHALTKARIIIQPGQVIELGTVVIRDGRIEAAGAGIAIPADARVWDLTGQTVYPGFVDPYFSLNATNPPVSTSRSEPIGAMSGAQFFGVPGSGGPGNTISPRIAPEQRASQKPGPNAKTTEELRELGFTAVNVVPSFGILRGTSALMSLGEGEPGMATLKSDVFQHVAFELPTGENQSYPESLMGVIAAVRQTLFDAQHYKLDLADYAKRPTTRNRPAYSQALESLQPALDGKQNVAFEPGSVLMQDRAIRMSKELGVQPVLVACGQEWRRPDMITTLDATFIVPLNFPAIPKLPTEEDWNDISLDQLRNWDWAPENPAVLRRARKDIALTLFGLSEKKTFRKQLQLAMDRGLSEDDALAALTTIPARLCGVEAMIGTVEAGKLANLVIVEGSYFDPKSKVQSVWIDGRHFPIEPDTKTFQLTVSTNKPASKDDKDAKAKESRETQRKRIARETLSDRGPLNQPAAVLITNATVWTSAKAGILTNASVLVRDGKIVRVGKFSETATDGILSIDGTGLHVTAGLIDCHSHTAIVGDVNEGTLPSTAMVRIGDVVNSETENLYQQLAGGLTAANLLHGSANPIGGQNCVIKLKYGAAPEDLKIKGAPEGIKFALGENVKQANWGEKYTKRFPQSRMGVTTFMANRFVAARQYLDAQEKARKDGTLPPARDLELEAIGEIIKGTRLIHCHSYRQDEILAFLRLMEQFNVKVATLQHILEGYKVADEIVRHGAGASMFSDWWGYKFEVYDAIPYNGSLMRNRGALVSFNSDSSELARRMYLEAAKAVKYGGTPEPDALNFVTINPATQLGLGERIGSLEPGKDADFAIWSGSPLLSSTVCLQTWIEGKQYFDRSKAPERATAREKERSDLIAKAKKLQGGDDDKKPSSPAVAAFFRTALEQSHKIMQCGECAEVRR